MKTISIIGAGAAGLMTAATILEHATGDYHIHLFEKNTAPGKKVIISGGGRCNLTTGITDKKLLLSKYTRGADFIKKAFGKFGPMKVREWFESHGVALKVQEDMRVFPVSDDGTEVVEVFEKMFAKHRDRIILHYGEGVESIGNTQNTKFGLKTRKGTYLSDVVVITTGGNAYSHTGSTGDGYAFARSLGHTVTPLGPSLSSFLTLEQWIHELSGLAFEEARICFTLSRHCDAGSNPENQKHGLPYSTMFHSQGQKQEKLSGPLLLTHFGISGPLAFMVASHLAFETIGLVPPGEGGIQGDSASKTISFSPIASMGTEAWDTFLKEQFQNHPKKLITSILVEQLPRRFVEGFIREHFSHITETFAASIPRKDREKIAELLGTGIPITLIGRHPGDEFVTAGGVETSELDPESMESKIQKNLYFAGEVLNVDGYTGGFSLQICWASGYAAGKEIVRRFAEIEKSI